MPYTVKTIPLSTASNYGSAMKQVVNVILSEFPNVSLHSVLQDTTSVYDVYLAIGSDGLITRLYNSSNNISQQIGNIQDGTFVYVYSNIISYVNYYSPGNPRYIKIYNYNNGGLILLKLVAQYGTDDYRNMYFHVLQLLNPYDGNTYTCSYPYISNRKVTVKDGAIHVLNLSGSSLTAFPQSLVSLTQSRFFDVTSQDEGTIFFTYPTVGGKNLYTCSEKNIPLNTLFNVGSNTFVVIYTESSYSTVLML